LIGEVARDFPGLAGAADKGQGMAFNAP